MKEITKLAEEAEKQWHAQGGRIRDFIPVVKSAIEKARSLGIDEMTQAGIEAVSESRAEHDDSAEDTKRLDWLLDKGGWIDWDNDWDRKAIDAAMKSEGKQ